MRRVLTRAAARRCTGYCYGTLKRRLWTPGWSVLEHLDDTLAVLHEVHRVARPDALVIIGVPHFSSANSYTDPTHRHHFSGRFLDYVIPGTELSERFGRLGYSRTSFALRMTRQELGSYLGIKLETVSRTLSAFAAAGLIEVASLCS